MGYLHESTNFLYLYLIIHQTHLFSDPSAVEHVSPLNQVVNENSSFSIYCNATGNPQPSITWKRMGLNSKSFPVGEVLTVRRAQLEDQGKYTCFAYNGIGITATASVNVEIKRK